MDGSAGPWRTCEKILLEWHVWSQERLQLFVTDDESSFMMHRP
jgi:hypothetical protein